MDAIRRQHSRSAKRDSLFLPRIAEAKVTALGPPGHTQRATWPAHGDGFVTGEEPWAHKAWLSLEKASHQTSVPDKDTVSVFQSHSLYELPQEDNPEQRQCLSLLRKWSLVGILRLSNLRAETQDKLKLSQNDFRIKLLALHQMKKCLEGT